MITVVPCLPKHIIELRKNLREDDAREIRNFGLCIRRTLWRSFNETLEPKTVLVGDKVAGVFGCCGTVLGQVGQPWMLATPVADEYPLQFCLLYRQEVRKMLDNYPVLENIVDASYSKAIKLLEIIGFKVYNAKPIGPNKAMFRKFRLVSDV